MNVHESAGTEDTALTIAVRQNRTDIMGLLLQGGADPNVKDGYGKTPIHIGAVADCR